MNILLINCILGPCPGHDVRALKLEEGGIVSLRRFLQRENGLPEEYVPDLIVQQELLGCRLFFNDLWTFPCPKIFWAIDSHLNLHWQRTYARLFSLVLTPHPSLFALDSTFRPFPPVVSFPMPGYDRSFTPHAQRSRFGIFVGRIDINRPLRLRFATFLKERHAILAEVMPFAEMLNVFQTTRVIPNEAICNEFNFRIMEGASCGCCVLTPDIGFDLECNFTPASEVLTYRHVQELDELLNFLERHPNLTEKIGRAAWLKVQNEHLLKHRWQKLLQCAQNLAENKVDREGHERLCLLAACEAVRADGSDAKTMTALLERLEQLPFHPDVLAMRIRLVSEIASAGDVLTLLDELLRLPDGKKVLSEPEIMLAFAGAALILADSTLLSRVLSLEEGKKWGLSSDPFTSALTLADQLRAAHRISRPGFVFSPQKNCPETTLEMLLVAERYAKTSEESRLVNKELAFVADAVPMQDLSLGMKARYSLEHQTNWRVSLDYALSCLKGFKLAEGLEELDLAGKLAFSAGDWDAYMSEIRHAGLGMQVLHKNELGTAAVDPIASRRA